MSAHPKDHRARATRPPFPKMLTYIGYCCREWILATGVPVGSCGLCGERPTYLREDDYGRERP